MAQANKSSRALIGWVTGVILIGALMGFVIKPELSTWYRTLNRSLLTPPNYLFPIVWTILYALIGSCGWIIWHTASFPRLPLLKSLYGLQLLLNWSWTPIFFHYHLTGFALGMLGVMDFAVSMIIQLAAARSKTVALLMLPYLGWLLFATYLNCYIWYFN